MFSLKSLSKLARVSAMCLFFMGSSSYALPTMQKVMDDFGSRCQVDVRNIKFHRTFNSMTGIDQTFTINFNHANENWNAYGRVRENVETTYKLDTTDDDVSIVSNVTDRYYDIFSVINTRTGLKEPLIGMQNRCKAIRKVADGKTKIFWILDSVVD